MQSKSLVLLAVAMLSFLVGLGGQYFFPGRDASPIDLLSIPVFALLIFWWYRLDAAQRGFKRSRGLNFGVVGIAALALPYYFFRSRGFGRGLLATIFLFSALLASGALTFAGQYAAYYGLQS